MEARGHILRQELQQRHLSQLFNGWAAYAAAMQADLEPDSPFRSPRSGQACRLTTRFPGTLISHVGFSQTHDVIPGSCMPSTQSMQMAGVLPTTTNPAATAHGMARPSHGPSAQISAARACSCVQAAGLKGCICSQRDRRLARRMAAMAGGGIASEEGSAEGEALWDDLYLSQGLEGLIQEDARMQPFLR